MAVFTYLCPLRWSDQDTYGHINNVQTLRLLEEARVALFFEQGPAHGIQSFEGSLVVVRHEIDYRRPLMYTPEPIVIEVWVGAIRNSSFTLGYRVRDDTQVYAEARTVGAAYDAAIGAARRLSPEERAFLGKYLND